MRFTKAAAALLTLTATGTALAVSSHNPDTIAHARAVCERLPPGRRSACLQGLHSLPTHGRDDAMVPRRWLDSADSAAADGLPGPDRAYPSSAHERAEVEEYCARSAPDEIESCVRRMLEYYALGPRLSDLAERATEVEDHKPAKPSPSVPISQTKEFAAAEAFCHTAHGHDALFACVREYLSNEMNPPERPDSHEYPPDSSYDPVESASAQVDLVERTNQPWAKEKRDVDAHAERALTEKPPPIFSRPRFHEHGNDDNDNDKRTPVSQDVQMAPRGVWDGLEEFAIEDRNDRHHRRNVGARGVEKIGPGPQDQDIDMPEIEGSASWEWGKRDVDVLAPLPPSEEDGLRADWEHVGVGPREDGVEGEESGDWVEEMSESLRQMIPRAAAGEEGDGNAHAVLGMVEWGRDRAKVAHVDAQDEEEAGHVNEKRNIAVSALDATGAIDLAIPISNHQAPNAAAAVVEQPDSDYVVTTAILNSDALATPLPTTLATTTRPDGLGPITIEDIISLATTTYPVHRTLQTATLANGTEIRLEQTESQVHDVHIEETEHEKDDPEQDKVVVHVKVFVEHVKEAAARMVRRRGVEDVQGKTAGQKWRCTLKWYGYSCGFGHKDEEEDKD